MKRRREKIIDIRGNYNKHEEGQKLKGILKLEGFDDAEILDCSDNWLVNINFGFEGCQKLFELDISNNKFRELNFLKSVPNLEVLRISGNQKLFPHNLKFLALLKELKKIDISNCSLSGSLEPLRELKKLKELKIYNTDIDSGLQYLPDTCEKLYCDRGYKSIKIVKELEKYGNCFEEEKDDKGNTIGKYHNLKKWREYKQDSDVATNFPLERLFVIRSNIKKFADKWWGEQVEDDWYERSEKKFINFINKSEKSQN